MNWLKKLPGFQRSPPGLEWVLLRLVPTALVAGTVLPGLAAFLARYWVTGTTEAEWARNIQLVDFALIGFVILIWTLVLTVTIGCVIVWLMKGPAYVADGFDVSHSDHPKP